jgi:hypothetical protein
VTTWITLSVIALLPMLLRAPKALTSLRISSDDQSRFSGMFRRYAIHTFTGYASDVDKRGDSYTRGSISSTTSTNYDVTASFNHSTSVTGSIDTEVVITDRFFLSNEKGQSQSFEGTGFEAQVGNGHLVSLAWVIRGRKRSGRYFLIYNHATGESFFNDKAIRKALTFPYPAGYIAILILMILPIPVVAFFGLAAMLQARRFQSVGVPPLISSLESGAVSLPVRAELTVQVAADTSTTRDLASALKEITALRDAGALSQTEFETAKAKLLTT